MAFQSEQENFWAGPFGDAYSERNQGSAMLAANAHLLRTALARAESIASVCELGCNIGLNLQAFAQIAPSLAITGYEINQNAAAIAAAQPGTTIHHATITQPLPTTTRYDLTFTKGVLIHINPGLLPVVYENLYQLSTRYILLCEYYNPSPVEVSYRDNAERLFKRDFAGDMLDRYPLRLVDYGFVYHRDPHVPQDDITWFLLEKKR